MSAVVGRLKKPLRDAAIVLVSTCVLLALLEAALRPVAYFLRGRSQYHLYYGFHHLAGRVGITPESTFQGQYYKFPPNYLLKGAAGQLSETASINSRGFRGPEFDAVKAPGVFRVICLGESSTFGYRDLDDETYPYYLQKLFDGDELHAEVINAGFPYYTSGSILALLKAEILQYRPDLITLYAGYNDTGWPMHMGLAGRAALWVQSHSIIYVLSRETFGDFVQKVERRLFSRTFPELRADAFRRNAELVKARYRANLKSIISIARSQGIRIVLIKQPVTTHIGNYLSLSYEEENRRLRERFSQGEILSSPELLLLKQHPLTEELEHIAAEESIPLVDNIRIVDQDRRRFASAVHLTPEANQRLAEALEDVIKPYVLSSQAPQPASLAVRPSRSAAGAAAVPAPR